jgi:hypothetical protein
MGGRRLTRQIVDHIEERSRALGKEANGGVAGKVGGEEEKITENQ